MAAYQTDRLSLACGARKLYKATIIGWIRAWVQFRGTGFSREEASTSTRYLSSEMTPSRLKPVPLRHIRLRANIESLTEIHTPSLPHKRTKATLRSPSLFVAKKA